MIKTDSWLISAIFALFLWGFWGFFQKLATNQMNPKSVYVSAAIGTLVVVCYALISLDFRPEMNPRGIVYAILGGLAGSAGGLLFVNSLSRGKASIVITMTALYPVITIILSFVILKEQITIKQGIGIILALASMVLLSV